MEESPRASQGLAWRAPFGALLGGPGEAYSEALLSRYWPKYTLSYVQMAQGPLGPWAWGGPK